MIKMGDDLGMLEFLLKTYKDLLVKTEGDTKDSFIQTVGNEIQTVFSKLQGELNG